MNAMQNPKAAKEGSVLSSTPCEIIAVLALFAVNWFKGFSTAKYAENRKGPQREFSKLGHYPKELEVLFLKVRD
jgi:hypothetical protein